MTLTEREHARRYDPRPHTGTMISHADTAEHSYWPVLSRTRDSCEQNDGLPHIVDRHSNRCLLCLGVITVRLSDGSILIRTEQ